MLKLVHEDEERADIDAGPVDLDELCRLAARQMLRMYTGRMAER